MQWRHDYLNEAPDEQIINACIGTLTGGTYGLFHVARQAGLNYAVAQRALNEAVRQGKIIAVRSTSGFQHYRATYAASAVADVEELRRILDGSYPVPPAETLVESA